MAQAAKKVFPGKMTGIEISALSGTRNVRRSVWDRQVRRRGRLQQVRLARITFKTCQRTLNRWVKDHCTAGLQFNKTGLGQGREYVVFCM